MGKSFKDAGCQQCGVERKDHANSDHAFVTPQQRARVARLDSGAAAYWASVDREYAQRGMTDDDAYDHYRENHR